MNRFPYAAKVLLLGLVTAQVLATIQVYLSNAHLEMDARTIQPGGLSG